MLDGLWIATAAPAVEAALAAMPTAGSIAVVAAPRLSRALTHRGRAVTAIDPAVAPLAIAPTYAAVIGVALGDRVDRAAQLAAWSAATVDGGTVILVDRGQATDGARFILCAGLTALEQRIAGRWTVTSGVVLRL